MKNRIGTLLGMASLGSFLIFMGFSAAAWIRNGVPGEMSNVEFAAEVIKAIAWPAVPVLFFVLFRERIDLLLEHVTFESPGGWKFTAKVDKHIDQALEKLVEGEQERGNVGDPLQKEDAAMDKPEAEIDSPGDKEADANSSPSSPPLRNEKASLDFVAGDDDRIGPSAYHFTGSTIITTKRPEWSSKQLSLVEALYTWERAVELAQAIAGELRTAPLYPNGGRWPYSPKKAFATILERGYINASEFESLLITQSTRNEIAHAKQPSLPDNVIEKFDSLTRAMYKLMIRVSNEVQNKATRRTSGDS